MKKKLFIIASAVLVFGLAIAVYALNSKTNASNDASVAACCCCSGDSCPAKDKNASSKSTSPAHENCDCCNGGGGDSCPMKAKDAKTGEKMAGAGDHCPMMNGHKAEGDMKHDMKMGDAESCPMMKGDASHKMHAGMKHEMKADGTAGCSCACCADQMEKKDAPAV